MTDVEFAKELLEKNKYEDAHRQQILSAIDQVIAQPAANELLMSLKRLYEAGQNFKDFQDQISALSRITGIHEYTLNLLLLLFCAKHLHEQYLAQGIDPEIFFDTMVDLKVKNLECVDNYGFCGTFAADWFRGIYNMTCFKLGRFEYGISQFHLPEYAFGEDTLKEGMFCLAMHIPSHLESLTASVRRDSYKKAYRFFRDRLQTKYLYIHCSSWLLFPDNVKILPPGSHTVDFLRDFHIYQRTDHEKFSDQWRIFGVAHRDSEARALPRDTSMQKAFAQWLEAGNPAGRGAGMLVFDGENVLTRNDMNRR